MTTCFDVTDTKVPFPFTGLSDQLRYHSLCSMHLGTPGVPPFCTEELMYWFSMRRTANGQRYWNISSTLSSEIVLNCSVLVDFSSFGTHNPSAYLHCWATFPRSPSELYTISVWAWDPSCTPRTVLIRSRCWGDTCSLDYTLDLLPARFFGVEGCGCVISYSFPLLHHFRCYRDGRLSLPLSLWGGHCASGLGAV